MISDGHSFGSGIRSESAGSIHIEDYAMGYMLLLTGRRAIKLLIKNTTPQNVINRTEVSRVQRRVMIQKIAEKTSNHFSAADVSSFCH